MPSLTPHPHTSHRRTVHRPLAAAALNTRYTALHYAAMAGQYYALAVLLQHGANKHARDNNGATALHWAAKGGQEDIVSLLLHYGADRHAKDM